MLEQMRRIDGNLRADDVLNFEDDFVGGINSLLWDIVSTLTGSQSSVSGAGGIRRLATGLTGLADTRLSLPAGAFLVRPDRNPIVEGRCRLAPTGTLTNLFFEMGIGDDTTGIVFQFNQAVSANWRLISRNGGVATTTTTAVTVATNTYYKLRVMATSSDAKFYLNDTLLGTHTTNLPSATGYNDLLAGYLRTGAVLTNVTADLDYIRLRQSRD